MNRDQTNLLVRHMMRSVNDRYALLNKLGLAENFIKMQNLEGSAWAVGVNVSHSIRMSYGDVETTKIHDLLKTFDLPEWMAKE